MKPVLHLRKRPLAACLAVALAIGVPVAVQGASAPGDRSTVRFDRGDTAAGIRARLASRESPDGLVAVTSCDDSGPGSLRDAIAAAGSGAHIDLRSLACSTITLDSAIPVGAVDVYLDGPGADRLTIDGGSVTRLFEAAADSRLTLTGLRLANGYAAGDGGCILSAGDVQLTDSLITGCHAYTSSFQARGGAISAHYVGLLRSTATSNLVESAASFAKGGAFYAIDTGTFYSTIDSNEARSSFSRGFGGGAFVQHNAVVDGTSVTRNHAYNAGGLSFIGGASYNVTLQETTVSGNVADGFIGGLYVHPSGAIMNSTIAFNCANQTEVQTGYISAVGIELYQSYAFFSSSIVSNNDLCPTSRAPQGSAYDVAARGTAGVTGDHNLVLVSGTPLPPDTIRADPMLAPLSDNGGHGLTHALLGGSPAIDTGSSFLALPWDGRWHWFPRTNGPAPDIGAFELAPTPNVRTATTCADSGAGSLRELAAASISGDTIDLSQLACSRITLTSGAIVLGQSQNDLRIRGPGSDALTIDGNGQDRLFVHGASGTFQLQGLTLENGYYAGGSDTRGGGCVLSFGLVTGLDVNFSACHAHATTTACYGGAIRAGAASLYRSRIADSGCTSDAGAAGGGGVAVDYELTLRNVTLANNVAEATATSDAPGGGFFARVEAHVDYSTISGNAAAVGGAGYTPKLVLAESTVSGNTASVQTGGLAAGMAAISNSTVVFNTTTAAGDSAGGLFVVSRGDLESSILFGNTSGGEANDAGTLIGALFGADNLVGASPSALPPGTIHDDPLLGPLQNNGGLTETHALGEGSPALDAGNNAANDATDQRGAGFARVFNGRADIGAVEMQPEGADTIFENGFD